MQEQERERGRRIRSGWAILARAALFAGTVVGPQVWLPEPTPIVNVTVIQVNTSETGQRPERPAREVDLVVMPADENGWADYLAELCWAIIEAAGASLLRGRRRRRDTRGLPGEEAPEVTE